MAEPMLTDVIRDITDDVRTIVRGEIELAKAEMMPQVKRAGIGAGMFGAAGYLAIQAATLLFVAGGLALGALYDGFLPVVWAFTLGFLTLAVLLLVVAGVLVLIGKNKVSITGPTATIDEAQRSLDAVLTGVERGNANVAAIVAGREPLRAPALYEAEAVSDAARTGGGATAAGAAGRVQASS